MDLVGHTLGKYKITDRVGAGGMASVYKAYQPGLDRYVAIKVLPAQHALTPGFKERFTAEAKIVAQLHHPNILPVHDAGIDGDLSYFVMQLVSGQSLRELLRVEPLSLERISLFIDQVAGALDHAHRQGIYHRDIKPDNMLIENEWLMLADFGLAKIRAGGQDLTGTGMIIGTPMYVAPEQITGDPVDHRADIYSLGVVLYEMVTGQVPYQAETSIGTMFKHVNEPLPPPRSHRPDLSPAIEQIIIKALAKKPEQRFDSAGSLAAALRAELSGRAPDTMPVTPVVKPARLFICYKRNAEPDQHLADYLYTTLTGQGHDVFIDRTMRTGEAWLERIDEQIQASDFLILLLSDHSAHSEMVQSEVRRAYEHRKRQGNPQMLTVRLNYDDLPPYAIDAFLDPRQHVTWHTEADNVKVVQSIIAALVGEATSSPISPVKAPGHRFSEDGGLLIDSDTLHPPLPEFDPRLLEALEAPGGVVKLRDKFYVERHADDQLRREISRLGTTTTIRASRQTGKSSLLVRGINHAKKQGAKVVTFDLQRLDTDRLTSPDLFLRDFAETIVRKLRLDPGEVASAWKSALGPQYKLTYLMEDYVLPETEELIILALDEVDRLLQLPFHTDFFGLLRSWHNSRALDEEWDKLNIVMIISTEPYMLIDDVNQSPFNVGLKIYLDDFDAGQMTDLNYRHGAPVTDSHIKTWCQLLGGQPYLTRKALYTMVTDKVTWPEFLQIATLDHGPFGDHLRRHQWLLKDEPNLRRAFKQIIDHDDAGDELSLFRLLQAGLVKGSGEAYTCRCDLYRMYFRDKLGG